MTRAKGGPKKNRNVQMNPEWAPNGANFHIDLLGGSPQGRAWVEGAGEVAVDTLLGHDSNLDALVGVSEYDPNLLNADGYLSGNALAFIGLARTAALGNGTWIIQIKEITPDHTIPFFFNLTDGNEITTNVIMYGQGRSAWLSGYDTGKIADVGESEHTGPIVKLGFVIDGLTGLVAWHGEADAGEFSEADQVGSRIAAYLKSYPDNWSVQSITHYESALTAAALAALTAI